MIMKLRIRIDKEITDSYVIQSNHIPRYKEFIQVGGHRYIVDYVVYNTGEILQNEIIDVIIYVTEIF